MRGFGKLILSLVVGLLAFELRLIADKNGTRSVNVSIDFVAVFKRPTG